MILEPLLFAIFNDRMGQLMEELENQPAPQANKNPRQEALRFIWETAKVIIIALAIIIPLRYFIIQPFFVKGASMENAFDDGDYILIDEISYRFAEPQRGDVVVFRFPQDRSEFFIKRIIGLPQDTVEIKNNKVIIHNSVYPNGFALDERYLARGQQTLGDLNVKLGPNEYFVLGDNRLRSSDSRRWGSLNRSLITGRVFFRAWPVNKFGGIPPTKYQ